METKVYLKSYGDYGMSYLDPIDEFKWTGRWKLDTIKTRRSYPPGYEGERKEFDVTVTLCVERQVGIFPWWKVWENENNFIFREEESYIGECALLESL